MTLPQNLKPSYNMLFGIAAFLFFLAVFSLDKGVVGTYYLLAIFGIYALTTKKQRKENIPKEAWRYFYITLALVFLITLSAALYHPDSLVRWRYAVYRDLILLPLVFIAFSAANIKFETLYKIIVTASLITLLWVVMILIESPQRWHGWLWQPINRGNIGMLAGMLCLAATIFFHDLRWKLVAGIGFLSGVFLSILSGSRGGWLAFFLVILTLLYQISRTHKAAIKYTMAGLVAVIVISVIFWDNLPISQRIEQTVNSLQAYLAGGNKHTSIGVRFEMWRASWHAFLENPLFGWGWNNYAQYAAKFKELGIVDLPAKEIGHPHSQYFLFLGEMGLLGILSFVTFLLYPVQHFIRKISQFNARADGHSAIICILPIIAFETIIEFCLSDDTLSQRHFMLILTVLTVWTMILIKKVKINTTHSQPATN